MISIKNLIWRVGFLVFLAAGSYAQAQTFSHVMVGVSQNPNSLSIVDLAARKVVGRVAIGEDPHEVVVSDDGKLAYVSSPTRNCIDVIDIESRKVLRTIDTMPGSAPHGLLLRNGKLYFTAGPFKSIGRYDLAGSRIDWMFGIGQNVALLVVTSDLKQIFGSSRSANAIVNLDLSSDKPSNWKSSIIPASKAPQGLEISPNQKELWTSNRDDGYVTIIDVATKKVLQTLPAVTTYSYRLAFTPDGKQVLITDPKTDQLVVLDAMTRKEVKRLKIGKKPTDILFEPDGSRAYIAQDNELAILDLSTRQVTGAITTGNYIAAMTWLPGK